jgi:trk system potassium uptake protein TrkH
MTLPGITTLTYAVRVGVIGKYLGQLCGVIAIINLAPLAASFVLGDHALGWRYSVVTVILIVLAALALRLPTPSRLQMNEALVVSVLAFLLAALTMLYPFTGAGLTPLDALLEAISGATTTGLSTVAAAEEKSRAFLFARAWLQWYCGLAIAVLSLVLIVGPGATARRLAAAGGEVDDIMGTSRAFAYRIMVVYVLLTLLGILLTLTVGQDPFSAIVHILCAVSTAGFSSFNDSLAALDGPAARMVVLSACLSGAIPMALYYQAWRQGWRVLVLDREVQALLLVVAIFSLFLWLNLTLTTPLDASSALARAAATVISAQTSTGFTTFDVGTLDRDAKLLLILSMFLGGSVGSTAGGIKIVRLLIFFRLLQIMIRRSALPRHAVIEPHLNGHQLGDDEIQRALLVILLYAVVMVLSWIPFVAYGYDPLDALFEVVSATGTVGLSVGITSTALEPLLKGVLCIDMLLGRVEVFALLVLCHPMTWFGTKEDTV